jgi:hypothetical protein
LEKFIKGKTREIENVSKWDNLSLLLLDCIGVDLNAYLDWLPIASLISFVFG